MGEELTSSNDNIELLQGIWKQLVNCSHGDVEGMEILDSKDR
jgi:hypothetical protein